MENNKKIIIPLLVAVFTLLLLTASATYAYIFVKATNNFSNPTIKSKIPDIGYVTLEQGDNLNLNLTAVQLEKKENDVTYYASSTGPTTVETSPVIAKASVTGNGTFKCDYTLSVTATGDIFSKSIDQGTGYLVLKVNAGTDGASTTTHDFNTVWKDLSITGSLTGLSSSTPKNITAQLYFKNSASKPQEVLNNTSGSISFKFSSINCTATA